MLHQRVKLRRLVLLTVLLGYLGGQIVHEAGHWAVLEIYRRGPVMSFTGLVQQEETPRYREGWSQFTAPDGEQVWLHLGTLPGNDAEWVLMLAAGPLAQVAAMLFGLAMVHFGKQAQMKVIGLLLALINSFGPMVYQSISLQRGGGGDEYFMAQFLGWSAAVVHVFFLGIAIVGLAVVMRNLSGWRTRLKWLGAVFVGFVGQGPLLMYANRITQKQVGLGNPYFRPVFGWSLPVVIVSVVAAIVLVAVLARWEKAG